MHKAGWARVVCLTSTLPAIPPWNGVEGLEWESLQVLEGEPIHLAMYPQWKVNIKVYR
tara:strand:- start:504 stop:677 length:174 start_codon:yes stop_codon:yes gene_type:complete